MKMLVYLICVLFISSCDLDRDNPYDIHNPNYKQPGSPKDTSNNTIATNQILTFNSYTVASKSNSSPYNFGADVDPNIYPGDIIYLETSVLNNGQNDVTGIKGIITSSNKLVSITKLDSGWYLTVLGNPDGLIKSGQIGYGTITNGKGTYQFAPNSFGYSVQFSVSLSAIPGDSIPFILKINDVKNNIWNIPFKIKISNYTQAHFLTFNSYSVASKSNSQTFDVVDQNIYPGT